MKKTAIELIAQERNDQLTKHHFTVKQDVISHHENELIQAALYAINQDVFAAPADWHYSFKDRMKKKDRVKQLVTASALIAAEIDRILYQDENT